MADARDRGSSGIGFRRILITGAGGFVGRRLAARLVDNRDVVLFSADRNSTPIAGVSALAMDLTNAADVDRVIRDVRPDLIIHLAAQSSVGQAAGAAASTWNTNLGGSLALASAIARHTPDATVLFASSAEVYGKAFNYGVASEDTLPQPQSSYAHSKLAAELMFADVLPTQARLIVARPSNHSGFGQDQRFVLPSFAAQLASGDPVIKVGNLTARRDFTHVDNVVDAYLALLSHAAGFKSRETFNIGSGASRSVGSLLEDLIAMSGGQVEVVVDSSRLRPVDVPVAAIDVSKLRSMTDWAPRIGLEQMLLELVGG